LIWGIPTKCLNLRNSNAKTALNFHFHGFYDAVNTDLIFGSVLLGFVGIFLIKKGNISVKYLGLQKQLNCWLKDTIDNNH
jgi:hypothetical protein